MATIVPPRDGSTADTSLPLYDGQQLSQSEFQRLYEECPKHQKFELIDGVVYMAAAQLRPHSRHEFILNWLLGVYELATFGVEGLHNATTIMDGKNEPQPDLQLRIRAEHGGRTIVTPGQYISGPPELIIEVAHSSLEFDLKKKLVMYQSQGVKEYLVIDIEGEKIHWFVWPGGERQMSSDGILRSVAFPGLWIHSEALFQERMSELQTVLNAGLNHPEHQEFVTRLKSRA